MNSFILFLYRLRQYITKNKGIFALFLLCSVFNTIMVIYCYGNLVPVVANRYTDNWEYRYYTVVFEEQVLSQESLDALCADPLIEAFRVSKTASRTVCGVYGKYPLLCLKGTTEYTAPDQIIVPVDADVTVGDLFSLWGQAFTVIGVHSTNGYYVPLETYLAYNGTEGIARLDLHSVNQQDPKNDRVLQRLQALMPEAHSVGGVADTLHIGDAKVSEQMMLMIAVHAFLAIAAHVFLLHHMLDANRQENAICMVLGAGKWQLTTMVFQEALFLCAVACGVGILLHWALYAPVFTQLNLEAYIRYTPGDYCFILLLMLAISLLAVLPVAVKAAGTTPTAARQKVL